MSVVPRLVLVVGLLSTLPVAAQVDSLEATGEIHEVGGPVSELKRPEVLDPEEVERRRRRQLVAAFELRLRSEMLRAGSKWSTADSQRIKGLRDSLSTYGGVAAYARADSLIARQERTNVIRLSWLYTCLWILGLFGVILPVTYYGGRIRRKVTLDNGEVVTWRLIKNPRRLTAQLYAVGLYLLVVPAAVSLALTLAPLTDHLLSRLDVEKVTSAGAVIDGVWAIGAAEVLRQQVYLIVLTGALGALGGTINISLELADRTPCPDGQVPPFMYYFFRPFNGLFMASVMYVALMSGQLVLFGESAATPSVWAVAFLALLTGLYSDDAKKRLTNLGKTIMGQDPPGQANNDPPSRDEREGAGPAEPASTEAGADQPPPPDPPFAGGDGYFGGAETEREGGADLASPRDDRS